MTPINRENVCQIVTIQMLTALYLKQELKLLKNYDHTRASKLRDRELVDMFA